MNTATSGLASNDFIASKGEYYIGIGSYPGNGWSCTNGTILYQINVGTDYGLNVALVRANSDGYLGLKYHQRAGSQSWLYAIAYHLVIS